MKVCEVQQAQSDPDSLAYAGPKNDHISACRGVNYSKTQLSDVMCEGQLLHIKLLHDILFQLCSVSLSCIAILVHLPNRSCRNRAFAIGCGSPLYCMWGTLGMAVKLKISMTTNMTAKIAGSLCPVACNSLCSKTGYK